MFVNIKLPYFQVINTNILFSCLLIFNTCSDDSDSDDTRLSSSEKIELISNPSFTAKKGEQILIELNVLNPDSIASISLLNTTIGQELIFADNIKKHFKMGYEIPVDVETGSDLNLNIVAKDILGEYSNTLEITVSIIGGQIVKVSIELPEQANLQVSDLELLSLTKTGVAEEGVIEVSEIGKQFVFLNNREGAPILISYIDPSKTNNVVNIETTALSLMLLSPLGANLDDTQKGEAYDVFHDNEKFKDLVKAVELAITSNPTNPFNESSFYLIEEIDRFLEIAVKDKGSRIKNENDPVNLELFNTTVSFNHKENVLSNYIAGIYKNGRFLASVKIPRNEFEFSLFPPAFETKIPMKVTYDFGAADGIFDIHITNGRNLNFNNENAEAKAENFKFIIGQIAQFYLGDLIKQKLGSVSGIIYENLKASFIPVHELAAKENPDVKEVINAINDIISGNAELVAKTLISELNDDTLLDGIKVKYFKSAFKVFDFMSKTEVAVNTLGALNDYLRLNADQDECVQISDEFAEECSNTKRLNIISFPTGMINCGTTFAEPFIVRVTDLNGSPLSEQTVNFSQHIWVGEFSRCGFRGSHQEYTQVSNDNGEVSFNVFWPKQCSTDTSIPIEDCPSEIICGCGNSFPNGYLVDLILNLRGENGNFAYDDFINNFTVQASCECN